MKTLTAYLATAVVLLAAQSAAAAHIGGSIDDDRDMDFSFYQLSVEPGEQFSISVTMTGLGEVDPGATVLGSFDFSIGFFSSTSNLIFEGYGLGDGLGDVSVGESDDLSDGLTSENIVHVAQSSNLSAADLSDLQQDTFTLATFFFRASDDVGAQSSLFIHVPELLDPLGNRFFLDVSVSPSVVTVVPLPAGLWLLLSALGMTATVLRRA